MEKPCRQPLHSFGHRLVGRAHAQPAPFRGQDSVRHRLLRLVGLRCGRAIRVRAQVERTSTLQEEPDSFTSAESPGTQSGRAGPLGLGFHLASGVQASTVREKKRREEKRIKISTPNFFVIVRRRKCLGNTHSTIALQLHYNYDAAFRVSHAAKAWSTSGLCIVKTLPPSKHWARRLISLEHPAPCFSQRPL